MVRAPMTQTLLAQLSFLESHVLLWLSNFKVSCSKCFHLLLSHYPSIFQILSHSLAQLAT